MALRVVLLLRCRSERHACPISLLMPLFRLRPGALPLSHPRTLFALVMAPWSIPVRLVLTSPPPSSPSSFLSSFSSPPQSAAVYRLVLGDYPGAYSRMRVTAAGPRRTMRKASIAGHREETTSWLLFLCISPFSPSLLRDVPPLTRPSRVHRLLPVITPWILLFTSAARLCVPQVPQSNAHLSSVPCLISLSGKLRLAPKRLWLNNSVPKPKPPVNYPNTPPPLHPRWPP